MKKLSSRWVPRLLIIENKRNDMIESMASLTLFRRSSSKFLRRYITVVESLFLFTRLK